MQLFAHQEMKGRGSVIGYEPSLFTTAVLNINTSCLNSDDFQVNIYAKMVTKEGGEERTSGLTRLTWRLTRQTRLTWRLTCRTAHNTLAENGFEMKGPPRHLYGRYKRGAAQEASLVSSLPCCHGVWARPRGTRARRLEHRLAPKRQAD